MRLWGDVPRGRLRWDMTANAQVAVTTWLFLVVAMDLWSGLSRKHLLTSCISVLLLLT